jgi:hypothetical protein
MWKAVGASVPGTSHIAKGTGCQDASGWRRHNGITCLAVADGAGTRPLSATGSALAVEQALDTVARLAGDENAPDDHADWLRAAFDSARDRIAAFASSTNRKPTEYATTLAVAILFPEHVVIGQIGDPIVVVGTRGHYLAVHPEAKVEYANETYFLTAGDWYEHLRITLLAGPVEVVALSSDGLKYKITNIRTGAPFGRFFDDLLGYLKTPEASSAGINKFLTGLTNDQTGDDKSLVAAIQVLARDGVHADGGEVWSVSVADGGAVGPTVLVVPAEQPAPFDAPPPNQVPEILVTDQG